MTIYFDHAATSPLRPEAAQALDRGLRYGGNASSLHGTGRQARRLVEDGREQLAALLGAKPTEVVFTAGGTEADNLAVKGLFWARAAGNATRRRILLAASEHHAVLDPVVNLMESSGAEIVWLPVDSYGRVQVSAVETALAADPQSVALISVMWANNEVGTIQPVEQVARLAAEHSIPVHVDAVQICGHLPIDFGSSAITAMSVSAHKMGGPIGAGALVVRRGVTVAPVLHGGGQEGGIRSGTLAAPLIAAFGAAAEASGRDLDAGARRVAGLRDRLIEVVQAAAPDAILRGDPSPDGRLPGNAHFTFAGCEGDSLLYLLDARGIECSTGSACRAGVPEPSHVLLAMGVPEAETRGALRFSLGWSSTAEEVEVLGEVLPMVLDRARRAGVHA